MYVLAIHVYSLAPLCMDLEFRCQGTPLKPEQQFLKQHETLVCLKWWVLLHLVRYGGISSSSDGGTSTNQMTVTKSSIRVWETS